MDFLESVINFASALVAASGAVIAIQGLSKYGEGRSQHNAGAQDEGLSKLIGGAAIVIIGLELVPKILDFFP